jgi:actin-related protein 9
VFEQLNAPGFTLLSPPLASIYALGSTTGVVVHLGARRTTSIFVVVDSIVRWDACVSVDVGQEDCRERFLELLMEDEGLDNELRVAFLDGRDEPWQAGVKEEWVAQISDKIWAEYLADDVQVPLAGEGLASGLILSATAAQNGEDEGGFDIAKK